MEQEKNTPLLSLRGGSVSSSSTYKITDMISPKNVKGSKSLPTFDHLTETTGSSQSLDIKQPRMSYFMILWTFITSLYSELAHGIKEIFILLWSTILLRLPFLKMMSSKNKKGNSSPTATSKTLRHSQIRKPITKPMKFYNANKMRGKTESKDGKSRK